jgi:hypothetical protein
VGKATPRAENVALRNIQSLTKTSAPELKGFDRMPSTENNPGMRHKFKIGDIVSYRLKTACSARLPARIQWHASCRQWKDSSRNIGSSIWPSVRFGVALPQIATRAICSSRRHPI